MSSDDEVEITGVREDPRKSAEYHRQRADMAEVVKREAQADEAEAEKDVERMYVMQDGERHRFEYLVHLVERSIDEQRVITQGELEHVKKMRWQDAAAANAQTQVAAPAPAAAAAAAAAAPQQSAPPAAAVSKEVAAPAAPALPPAKPIKPPTRAIQKLVDANKAAINPPGAELLPAALQAHMLVWGYYQSDRVWYPGAVRDIDGQRSVLFDDGDEDAELDDMDDPRPWRLRTDEGSSSSRQADPEPKRRRLAKDPAPALARAPAPSEQVALPAPAAIPELVEPAETARMAAPPTTAIASAAAAAPASAVTPIAAPANEPAAAAASALAMVVPTRPTAGVWQVKLGGTFVRYEDPDVELKLEAAFLSGTKDFVVPIMVRGQHYHVHRNGAMFEQALDTDKTKVRTVRRVTPTAFTDRENLTTGPAAATAALVVALTPAPAAASSSVSTATFRGDERSKWWDDPRRLSCDDKLWPKRIPNLEVQSTFMRLVKSNHVCPLLSYMIWDICHCDNSTAQCNSSFIRLCEEFDVLDRGFGAVCDDNHERNDTVKRNGSVVNYPQYKKGKEPPPAGLGYHPTLHGQPRRYAKKVSAIVGGNGAGNGGVTANTIQDFLENIRLHPANANRCHDGSRAYQLSFLFDMAPEQQRCAAYGMHSNASMALCAVCSRATVLALALRPHSRT